MLYLIVRSLAAVLFKIFFRLKVTGVENIPSEGGFILASNHASYLDPPVLGVASPRALSYLAKEELFRVPFLGSLIRNLNSLPVNKAHGDLSSLRQAIKGLKRGEAVLIFPEGGRSYNGNLGPPLRGIGFLAVSADVPIVPAFVSGSFKAWPRPRRILRFCNIKVYFGNVFDPQHIKKGFVKKDDNYYREIAEEVISRIRQLKEKNEIST